MTAQQYSAMPLKEIFNREASIAHLNFPEVLSKLVVINAGESVYVSEAAVNALTKKLSIIKHFLNKGKILTLGKVLEYVDNSLKSDRTAAAFFKVNYQQSGLKIIGLKDFSTRNGSKNYTNKMYSIDAYNHEIGHLLVKNGVAYSGNFYEQHIAECAADAFSALRHIQLFGKETDFFKYANYSHAIVEGFSPIHYMDIVLQKIEAVSKEQDISALSFKDTVKLAGEIAKEYHLSEDTLDTITAAFVSVAALNGQGNKIQATECYKVMQQYKNDHDIYRAGKRYLEIPAVKNCIDMAEPFWVDAFKDMEQFEKSSGIILNLAKALDAERAVISKTAPIRKQEL